jgi:hypothetical protein
MRASEDLGLGLSWWRASLFFPMMIQRPTFNFCIGGIIPRSTSQSLFELPVFEEELLSFVLAHLPDALDGRVRESGLDFCMATENDAIV